MRELPLIAGCGAALLFAAAARAQSAPAPSRGLVLQASIEPELAVADHRLQDLDGRPGAELVIVGRRGEVRTFGWRREPGLAASAARGTLVLAEPARSLLAIGALSRPDGPIELVSVSPRGVEAWPADAEGVFGGEAQALAPRARFAWRVDVPTFAPLLEDVDGDGQLDFVLPTRDALELWVHEGPRTGPGEAQAPPRLRRAARVPVEVAVTSETGAEEISVRLESGFTIPALSLADVNGDGRPDLQVVDQNRRAWHLVRADGAIPAEPDVSVDLTLFRDTTPKAELTPGRTLAGDEGVRFESRDLDLDGIPDYVIAHRRKVWVFHGRASGPQFTEPSTVLIASDDVTALVVLALDDDRHPDLLLIRVQVPSVATLLRGLLREWEVEISAIGYKSVDGRTFEASPRWKSTVSVRLPAILSVVKDPATLIARFRDVGRKFRTPCEADLDGDGREDVALLSEDNARLDVWLGSGVADTPEEDERVLRRLLFEDEQKSWDIDRILGWIGGFAERRVALATGGRAPDRTIALRAGGEWTLETLEGAALAGSPRAVLCLRYGREGDRGRKRFDFVGLD